MSEEHIAEQKLLAMVPLLMDELRSEGIIKDADPVIECSLVPNAKLRELKKEYLQKDVEIVDVLAFPADEFPDPEAGPHYLGEVYINEDIARDDISRAVFLLVHGVLHLLGYRHEEKDDIIVMEELEKKVHHALISKFTP